MYTTTVCVSLKFRQQQCGFLETRVNAVQAITKH